VFVIADSVPVIYRNHGLRVRSGISFYVNTSLSIDSQVIVGSHISRILVCPQ
jgi:hypothetical protein